MDQSIIGQKAILGIRFAVQHERCDPILVNQPCDPTVVDQRCERKMKLNVQAFKSIVIPSAGRSRLVILRGPNREVLETVIRTLCAEVGLQCAMIVSLGCRYQFDQDFRRALNKSLPVIVLSDYWESPDDYESYIDEVRRSNNYSLGIFTTIRFHDDQRAMFVVVDQHPQEPRQFIYWQRQGQKEVQRTLDHLILRVLNYTNNGSVFILLRGLPGSRKELVAEEIYRFCCQQRKQIVMCKCTCEGGGLTNEHEDICLGDFRNAVELRPQVLLFMGEFIQHSDFDLQEVTQRWIFEMDHVDQGFVPVLRRMINDSTLNLDEELRWDQLRWMWDNFVQMEDSILCQFPFDAEIL